MLIWRLVHNNMCLPIIQEEVTKRKIEDQMEALKDWQINYLYFKDEKLFSYLTLWFSWWWFNGRWRIWQAIYKKPRCLFLFQKSCQLEITQGAFFVCWLTIFRPLCCRGWKTLLDDFISNDAEEGATTVRRIGITRANDKSRQCYQGPVNFAKLMYLSCEFWYIYIYIYIEAWQRKCESRVTSSWVLMWKFPDGGWLAECI